METIRTIRERMYVILRKTQNKWNLQFIVFLIGYYSECYDLHGKKYFSL